MLISSVKCVPQGRNKITVYRNLYGPKNTVNQGSKNRKTHVLGSDFMISGSHSHYFSELREFFIEHEENIGI